MIKFLTGNCENMLILAESGSDCLMNEILNSWSFAGVCIIVVVSKFLFFKLTCHGGPADDK